MPEINSKKPKTKRAIAISCKEDQGSEVLASGEAEIADLIIAVAKHAQIPVEENQELIQLLKNQGPGMIVSERALKVLAQVIAVLYQADEQKRKGTTASNNPANMPFLDFYPAGA